jgi:hypothetical protein
MGIYVQPFLEDIDIPRATVRFDQVDVVGGSVVVREGRRKCAPDRSAVG